jgi:uncharacterized membrane protein
MAMLTKRSTVMGLPVGRSKVAWGRVAMLGGAAAATVAGGQRGRQKLHDVSDQIREPLEHGKEVLGEASEISEDVHEFTDKFTGGGKGGGGGGGLLSKAASILPGVGGGSGGGDGKYTKKLRLVTKLAQDVAVPRRVAYNQWTQYEDFPDFMKGVISVEPEDELTQKWTVKIGPSKRTFTGEVQEQVPDERIEWKGTDGTQHYGVVTFHELDENLTRVQIEMEYYPQGFIEKVGNIFLAARRKARKDLRLFKHYMELENEETGSWRGEISEGEVVESDDSEEGEEEATEEGEEEATEEETEEEQSDGERQPAGERAEGNGSASDSESESDTEHAQAS